MISGTDPALMEFIRKITEDQMRQRGMSGRLPNGAGAAAQISPEFQAMGAEYQPSSSPRKTVRGWGQEFSVADRSPMAAAAPIAGPPDLEGVDMSGPMLFDESMGPQTVMVQGQVDPIQTISAPISSSLESGGLPKGIDPLALPDPRGPDLTPVPATSAGSLGQTAGPGKGVMDWIKSIAGMAQAGMRGYQGGGQTRWQDPRMRGY